MKNKWANNNGIDQRIIRYILRSAITQAIDKKAINPKVGGRTIAHIYNIIERNVNRRLIDLVNHNLER